MRAPLLRGWLADGLLPALCGVLATLGFAPFYIWPATIAALVGLILLWRRATPGRAAWRGFVFGGAQFGTGIYWVYVAMHGHAGMSAWLAGPATAGLAAYLALYPMLAGIVVGLLRRLAFAPWALLVVPAAWTITEWLRGWLFTGFDWLAIGYIATDIPFDGLAPVLGVYGLSFGIMAFAATLVLLCTGGLVERGIACLLVLVLPVVLWGVPPAEHWTAPSGRPIRVAIIQGNIAQQDKWRPRMLVPTLARYQAMTQHADVDLVVWPEVAIPATDVAVARSLQRIQRDAAADDKLVLAGLMQAAPGAGRFYNTLLAIGAGEGVYHKRHLVPFGEYVPGPAWLGGLLSGLGAPVGRLATGAEHQPLIHRAGLAMGVSICFEDVFARNIIGDLPRANLLVNVTNDGWFAGTTGPAQHLQIARLRAAEAGRPLVRAANTGISAYIGFDGRLYGHTRENETARLVSTVTPRRGLTPFGRFGNTLVIAAAFGIVLLAGLLAGVGGWRAHRRDRVDERRRELMRRV